MDAAAIINVLDMVSVALLIAATGLQSKLGLGLAFVRGDPAGATRSMLAMFVAMPAFVLSATWILPLERPVALALLALAVSPMPPFLPAKEKAIGGTNDYIAGTLLLAPLVALIAIPLFVWIAGGVFGLSVNHDPVAVLHILVVTLCAPWLIGLLVNRFAPTAAARLVRPFKLLGIGLLVIAGIALPLVAFPAIRNAVGSGTLLVIVAIAAFGLLAGHLAGGPHPGNQRALALICSQRHPGVAMAIAVAAFPDEAQATLGAVLLYVVASAVIAVPYVRWAAGAPESQS